MQSDRSSYRAPTLSGAYVRFRLARFKAHLQNPSVFIWDPIRVYLWIKIGLMSLGSDYATLSRKDEPVRRRRFRPSLAERAAR
ncbi:hypothetical protein IAD21_03426 [Abditibacteriota bacterium]|nr:hypothetical protein IAD21_03426 [Abditibacteriota bacterium]